MPYTIRNPPAWLRKLPKGAIRIGVETFNRVLSETNDEERARQAAWSNIKVRYKKMGERWVRRSETEAPGVLRRIELTITKASTRDGRQYWALTASDTKTDKQGDATSLALFEDWISRVEAGKTVDWLPAPGMPFLGLSHYSRQDGYNEAGLTERLYIDGRQFKASGLFSSGPIGQALFQVIRAERQRARKGETIDDPVRISAAWWDVQHAHGDEVFTRQSIMDLCPMCLQGKGQRQFLKGQLDHFAGTRVPINPRTEIGLEERAMAVTRETDAASIVGDDMAAELERREREQLEARSEADQTPAAMMVRGDDEDVPAQSAEAVVPETGVGSEAERQEAVIPDLEAEEPELVDDWQKGEEIIDPVEALLLEISDEPAGDVQRATMKTVGGKKYPAGDFLVVEDAGEPTTWHLQVKRNGQNDHRLMGAAWAALGPKGFRGKKYKGPDKRKAKQSLRALYEDEGLTPPGQSKAETVLVEGHPIGLWLPYGGATTIDDAVAYQEAQMRLTDFYRAWDMHQAVVENIQRTKSAEEIPDAMMAANNEFAALVATMRAEHLAQPNQGEVPMTEPTQQSQTQPPAGVATPPAAAVLPQAVSGQADWLVAFQSEIGVALGQTPQTRQEREQRIQEAFNQVAQSVMGQLNVVSPPDLSEQVRAAVQDAMSPLTDSVAYLMALQNQRPEPQMRPQQPVPQQRSVAPAPVPQGLQTRGLPISPVTGQPSQLTSITRRSVGIREGTTHNHPAPG